MNILPYDLYVAADLFLNTGRSEADVLTRLGLTPARWKALSSAHFDLLHGDRYLPAVQALWPGHDPRELLAALVGPRWVMPPGEPEPSATVRGIRGAVHAGPHIGPFAGTPLRAVHIVDDPVASLRYYSHDGARVYFWGVPLADRTGAALDLDAPAFRHLGGRWYTDGRRILGQGEVGSRPRRYWWTLEGADPGSFRALNLRYAKDAERAWYITGKAIRTRSPGAFAVVPDVNFDWVSRDAVPIVDRSYVARDGERVYSYGAAVRGADSARFRALGRGYWTDDRGVWIDDGKVPVVGADAASFIVPGPNDPPIGGGDAGDGTDRDRPYRCGRPVPLAAAFDDWAAFFLAREDAGAWWWGRLRDGTDGAEGSPT